MSAEPNLKIRINLMKPGSENDPRPVSAPKQAPAARFPWRHLTAAGVVVAVGIAGFWLFGGQDQAPQVSDPAVASLNDTSLNSTSLNSKNDEMPTVDLRPAVSVDVSTPVKWETAESSGLESVDSSVAENESPDTITPMAATISQDEGMAAVDVTTQEIGDISETRDTERAKEETVPATVAVPGGQPLSLAEPHSPEREMAEPREAVLQTAQVSGVVSESPDVAVEMAPLVEEAAAPQAEDSVVLNPEPDVQSADRVEESGPEGQESPGEAVAAGGHIARTQLTSGIDALEPVDRIGPDLEAARDGARRIYFFSDIRNMSGDTVTHQWRYDDQEVARVIIPVKGDRWRAYSSKWLEPGKQGDWEVLVADSSGEVLHRQRFRYGN